MVLIRKGFFLFSLFILFIQIGSTQSTVVAERGINPLIDRLTKSVITFLNEQRVPSVSIIGLRNRTQLSDDAVQKIYQLIVYRLDRDKSIDFKDSMLSFTKGVGRFNRRTHRTVRFLMSVTMIRNRSRIGFGVSIFSVNLDKTVFVKYVESDVTHGEVSFLNIRENRFSEFGFEKIVELDSKKGLLDMRSVVSSAESSAAPLYYFYYIDRIQVFQFSSNRLKKIAVIKLNETDASDFFPAIEVEGRLFFFTFGTDSYMVVSNNTRKNSLVYKNQQGTWESVAKIGFVPFEAFLSNNKHYFIGGQYEPGKNYFKENLVLKSIENTLNGVDEKFYKRIEPFYSISFLKENDRIVSMYTIDRKYQFINYGANFEATESNQSRFGYAFSVLENQWIVRTAYTSASDQLKFYKINEIEDKPKYEKPISGEVHFINGGQWNQMKGLWVYVKKRINNYDVYKLQFWSKKNGS